MAAYKMPCLTCKHYVTVPNYCNFSECNLVTHNRKKALTWAEIWEGEKECSDYEFKPTRSKRKEKRP